MFQQAENELSKATNQNQGHQINRALMALVKKEFTQCLRICEEHDLINAVPGMYKMAQKFVDKETEAP